MGDQPKQILVIESDDADRERCVELVRGAFEGAEVTEVTDIASGLSVLRETVHYCAFVDFRFPDGTAIDLLKRARACKTTIRTPIVILTAESDEAATRKTLSLGAQDYLLKQTSISPESLRRLVAFARERHRAITLERQLLHSGRLAALGQLSAGIAHEINNPSTYLTMNLSMLDEHLRSLEDRLSSVPPSPSPSVPDDTTERLSEMRDMVEECAVGMERIGRLVHGLRGFSQKGTSEIELFSLHDALGAAYDLTSSELRHRARFVKELGQLPAIAGNRREICQLFTNLLINAAQAIQEGHASKNEIKVSTRYDRASKTLYATLEDTGIGLPESAESQIFDPFFTTKETNTGLGLTVCREIVEKHHGRILARPRAGGGTVVELEFPRDTGLQPSSVTGGLDAGSAPRRARILVVDDEGRVRTTFERELGKKHDIVTAPSGHAALALLEQDTSFDVIISDLMMPELDGQELYGELTTRHPDLVDSVVFCSGGAFTDRTRQFINSTPAPCIDKPVDWKVLERLIQERVRA